MKFDRPLISIGYSINLGDKGEDAYPEIGGIYYSPDKTELIMEIQLEP